MKKFIIDYELLIFSVNTHGIFLLKDKKGIRITKS